MRRPIVLILAATACSSGRPGNGAAGEGGSAGAIVRPSSGGMTGLAGASAAGGTLAAGGALAMSAGAGTGANATTGGVASASGGAAAASAGGTGGSAGGAGGSAGASALGTPAGGTPDAGSETDAGDASSASGHVVGTMRIEVTGPSNRTLPVQLWYPAVESARAASIAARSVSEFEPPGANRDTLTMLMASAPDECMSKVQHAAPSPEPLPSSTAFPVVIMSHCHSGVRFAMFSAAERLAQDGFVVVAPDHVGDTIYEQAANTPGPLSADELVLRKNDLMKVLDTVFDATSTSVPPGLRGKLDPARVGLVGHSMGSITAGLETWSDPRIKASVFTASPPTFPLLSSAVLADFKPPALFFYATEDNNLPTAVNDIIKSDYMTYPKEAWLAEVADAGHWSFTDILGIFPGMPGCGTAMRQTEPTVSFKYLDPVVARELTVRYVSAFFERTLLHLPGADLDHATPVAVVTLGHHP